MVSRDKSSIYHVTLSLYQTCPFFRLAIPKSNPNSPIELTSTGNHTKKLKQMRYFCFCMYEYLKP